MQLAFNKTKFRFLLKVIIFLYSIPFQSALGMDAEMEKLQGDLVLFSNKFSTYKNLWHGSKSLSDRNDRIKGINESILKLQGGKKIHPKLDVDIPDYKESERLLLSSNKTETLSKYGLAIEKEPSKASKERFALMLENEKGKQNPFRFHFCLAIMNQTIKLCQEDSFYEGKSINEDVKSILQIQFYLLKTVFLLFNRTRINTYRIQLQILELIKSLDTIKPFISIWDIAQTKNEMAFREMKSHVLWTIIEFNFFIASFDEFICNKPNVLLSKFSNSKISFAKLIQRPIETLYTESPSQDKKWILSGEAPKLKISQKCLASLNELSEVATSVLSSRKDSPIEKKWISFRASREIEIFSQAISVSQMSAFFSFFEKKPLELLSCAEIISDNGNLDLKTLTHTLAGETKISDNRELYEKGLHSYNFLENRISRLNEEEKKKDYYTSKTVEIGGDSFLQVTFNDNAENVLTSRNFLQKCHFQKSMFPSSYTPEEISKILCDVCLLAAEKIERKVCKAIANEKKCFEKFNRASARTKERLEKQWIESKEKLEKISSINIEVTVNYKKVDYTLFYDPVKQIFITIYPVFEA